MMDYQQVRKRVEEEDRVLKKIVIETGIGMFLALLITIFIVRYPRKNRRKEKTVKITKKNGHETLYDDEKVISSILKANAETSGEKLSRTIAASIAADVFNRLTAENEIITTAEIRECVDLILRERGYPETAKRYTEYKKA